MISQTTDLDDISAESVAALLNHELRTPLSTILGAAQLLERELEELAVPASTQELLQLLHQSVGRLERAVEVLTVFSRLANSPGNFCPMLVTPIQVNDLLQEIAVPFLPRARTKNVYLHLELDLLLPPVCSDAGKLGEIFRQLLSNALKFTAPGGRITVSTERASQSVQVSFQDTGSGISPVHQRLVFAPFFQAEHHMSRRHAGLGLGLTIAQRLLSGLGGRMQVRSSSGQGSCFTAVLPLVHMEEHHQQAFQKSECEHERAAT